MGRGPSNRAVSRGWLVSPDWVSSLLIRFSVFWSLEAMRRAWVRKNREARGNKDLSSPQTPFIDGGPTRFVEHRTSHGGASGQTPGSWFTRARWCDLCGCYMGPVEDGTRLECSNAFCDSHKERG